MSAWIRLRGTHPLPSPFFLNPPQTPPNHTQLTFNKDKILTSKYNKPFPVTLLPSAIGAYMAYVFAEKQGIRQQQILDDIRALAEGRIEEVKRIAERGR